MAVIGRKARQQHRGRDVADDLAGRRADEQRGQRDERAERALDGGNARKIARKDEKRAEGEQQTVIHFEERAGFEHQQRERDDGKPDIERENAENDEHRQREKHEINHCTPHGRRGDFGRFKRNGFGFHDKAGQGYQHERNGKRQGHYGKELARVYGIIGVKIQVLRIAERREHTAEVCGDVLHYKHESGILFLAAGREREPPERQKSYERHIVRHNHRAEIGHEDQRERDAAHIAERRDYLARQPLEKVSFFEGGHDGERAEQTRKRVEVEIIGISRVGMHENAGHRGGDSGND